MGSEYHQLHYNGIIMRISSYQKLWREEIPSSLLPPSFGNSIYSYSLLGHSLNDRETLLRLLYRIIVQFIRIMRNNKPLYWTVTIIITFAVINKTQKETMRFRSLWKIYILFIGYLRLLNHDRSRHCTNHPLHSVIWGKCVSGRQFRGKFWWWKQIMLVSFFLNSVFSDESVVRPTIVCENGCR